MAMTTACDRTKTASIDDKDALARLKQAMDGTHGCGTQVSATWPIAFSADALALPSIDTLASAGIVMRSPVAMPAGERERVRLLPAATGRNDVLLSRLENGLPQPKLCFGRKRIEAVTIKPGGAGDRQLHHTYRIVDAPDWTGRPDIRAAFPFLDRLLARRVMAANTVAIGGDSLDLPAERERFDDAGLRTHGFFACPVPDEQPDTPCR